MVWCRPRTNQLFAFDCRLEIFIPAKSEHGGMLPFLMGDRLAGRVDLKADRRNRLLVV
ncbi:MAG: crosslink repair DNA glycosylase YcaQ family protein [Acidobacteriota bacterium]|nr:crosslink repair DNA glycosylase YcaQ family protein [Acidobacteriota bacterium]